MVLWRRLLAPAVLTLLSGCNCGGGDTIRKLHGVLSIDPETVDFGKVAVGTLSVRGIKLTNKGNAAITFASVKVQGDGSVFALGSAAPSMLAPSMSIDISLAFTPAMRGPAMGTLRIISDADSAP